MSNFQIPSTPTVPLQPEKPKRRMPVWLIVVLCVIGLPILACIGLAVLGSLPQVQQAARDQATSVAATATVDAQEVATLSKSAKTFFEETFDSDAGNIDTDPNEMGQASIKNGVYTFTYITKGQYTVYSSKPVTNFIAEVECSVIRGNKDGLCGIVFALNVTDKEKEKSDHYWFYVQNGKYGVETNKGNSKKSFEKSNDAIKSGDNTINRLKVIRVNNDTRYYVNDVLVDRITDDTLTTGGFGFQTGAEKSGVQVQVDNFKVSKLP